MRMLKKAENAFTLLVCLAENGRRFQSLQTILERHELTLENTNAIILALHKARLVDGKCGHAGGYRLAQAPWSISLYDVFLALDSRFSESLLPMLNEPPTTEIGRAICEAIRKDGAYELRRLTLEKLAERTSASPGTRREPARLPRDRLALAE